MIFLLFVVSMDKLVSDIQEQVQFAACFTV